MGRFSFNRFATTRALPGALIAALVLLPASARAAIVINEIFPNPLSATDVEERIEIYNTGPAAVNVTGWAIHDRATIDGNPSPARCWLPEDFDATCPGGALIQPGEYRLVKIRPGQGAAFLNNDGDDVYLCSNRTIPATVLQVVTYPDTHMPVPDAHAGHSWGAVPNGSTNFDWRTTPTLCASNGGMTGDVTPPSTVSNLLAAPGPYPGEIVLSWTAPGDDGMTGTASQYEIKAAHVPITGANFTSVADVGRWISIPDPIAGGTGQSLTIFGLVDSVYYFALRALDEVPNTGGVSNSPSTAPLPGVRLNPNLGYTPYFGNLHSHTGYSDGVQTPANAYNYARFTAPTPLDFLAVTEHNHSAAGMSLSNYPNLISQANAANSDGNFVAIFGQEWGVADDGHVNIFEAPGLFGWESGNYDYFVQQSLYSALYTAMLAHPPASSPPIGEFCHPASSNFTGLLATDDGKTVMRLMALVNGPFDSGSTTESDIGNTGFDDAFQLALRNGFRVSPTADQDNHNATWGASSQSRTAVLTTAKTKSLILGGMAARRTYATQDHNTRVDFSANGHPMGEAFISPQGIVIAAKVTDPDLTGVAEVELYRGVTGVSTAVRVAHTLENAEFNWRELQSFANGTEVHYYLRIRMASNASIWTGPVYVTYDATSTVGVRAPQESARLSFTVGPIPSRGDVTASFDLPRAVPHVRLSVFDLTGRLVRTLAHGPLGPGDHRYVWDGRSDDGSRAPAGIYMVHLDTSVGSVARRVLRLN